MFPERIDRMVLDGVVNSHQWYSGRSVAHVSQLCGDLLLPRTTYFPGFILAFYCTYLHSHAYIIFFTDGFSNPNRYETLPSLEIVALALPFVFSKHVYCNGTPIFRPRSGAILFHRFHVLPSS